MRKIENPYMRKKNEIAKKIEENERELDAITSFFTKLLAQLGTFKYTKSRRGKLIMSIFPITEKYLPDINDWTRKDIYNGLREMSTHDVKNATGVEVPEFYQTAYVTSALTTVTIIPEIIVSNTLINAFPITPIIERPKAAIREWTPLSVGVIPGRNPESLRGVRKCVNQCAGDYNLGDYSYRRGIGAVRTCSNGNGFNWGNRVSILSIQGRKGRASSGGSSLMEAFA